MSRQLRVEFPGAIWHITSRGNERREIYRDDGDRQIFLDLLADVVTSRRWTLYAYAMMPNHYHLLFEQIEPGLSPPMAADRRAKSRTFPSPRRPSFTRVA